MSRGGRAERTPRFASVLVGTRGVATDAGSAAPEREVALEQGESLASMHNMAFSEVDLASGLGKATRCHGHARHARVADAACGGHRGGGRVSVGAGPGCSRHPHADRCVASRACRGAAPASSSSSCCLCVVARTHPRQLCGRAWRRTFDAVAHRHQAGPQAIDQSLLQAIAVRGRRRQHRCTCGRRVGRGSLVV